MAPGAGLRRNQAIVSASVTISALMRGLIDQPTTSRLNRSRTTARYSHPSSVQMYVMSDVKTWFGAVGAKLRSSRFGATGNLCFESVVTR
ncbi:hypothetical protein LMG23994_05141 [Cupriavidus pinatubonensis]|uniref:Uncharacterized protein n=1 Tax=Cupriavidus pinatubonensis TaxID=248026 RepID=A0ABM8XT17_9BURK|nr:hypothetical protein LMG23994_05141 [Cupriavidus pinatubonensis]